jgi:hypothetical protein
MIARMKLFYKRQHLFLAAVRGLPWYHNGFNWGALNVNRSLICCSKKNSLDLTPRSQYSLVHLFYFVINSTE